MKYKKHKYFIFPVISVVVVASLVISLRVFMFKQLIGIEPYVCFYETADCEVISNANNKMYTAAAFDKFMIQPRYYG